jgi:hypothetical protein
MAQPQQYKNTLDARFILADLEAKGVNMCKKEKL